MPTPLQNINAEKIQGNLAITSVSATTYYNLPTIGGFTGGTVAGATIFTNGLTANTISATTYYNLPISTDISVTGGTYAAGTAIFTNNTGGTFTVTGFSTGTSSTDIYTTGATYSNNNFLFTNNTGGTFNVLFNTVTGLTVNGDLNVTGNTNLKSLSATSATLSGSGSNILTIIGSGDTSNPIFTIQNLSGNTIFSVADYTSGPLFWVDTANGSPILEVNEFSPQLVIYGGISGSSLTATTISASTYLNLPTSTDVRVTGGTYTAGTATFTNNTGGTFSVSGFNTNISPISVVNTSSLFSTGLSGTGVGASGVTNSLFLGDSAGSGATYGDNSTFIGYQAGKGGIYSSDSNFIGYNAGLNAIGGGMSNFFGTSAGQYATYAGQSNFFGRSAGYEAINASQSNFFGAFAGYGATNASKSNFLGTSAGYGAINANNSNFLGDGAGYGAANAIESNFIGSGVGGNATNASGSTFIGTNSGNQATNADNSNFIGYYTGYLATGASYSNIFGYKAGRASSQANSIGSNNIIIGTNITLTTGATNSINIGGVLFGTGTYSATTGNPIISATTGGRIGIGVVNPLTTLHVVGDTLIQGNLTANTVSATTYYNLPTSTDTFVTGGTYSSGTATFTNNTGGTFSVSGFSSGGGSSSGICGIANSGGTYTYYSTLSAAITAAISGQTVDLLTDIIETGSVTLTMKAGVKINGNGYTYTLSVNDDTSVMNNGTSLLIELFNLKVIRTGRAINLGGRVFVKGDTTQLLHLKCQNVVFENTYGNAVLANTTMIYGLTINSYGDGVYAPYDSTGLNNCIITSSNAYGVNLPNSGYDIINCNVIGSTTGIFGGYGAVYNSIGKTTSGNGINAVKVVNSTGISSSGNGVGATNGYNCVGISTSSVGLNGTFTNSTGISTSGFAGSGGVKTNCTLISSSNYGSNLENLNNCFLQSTTNVPLWLNSSKLVNSCTVICLWDNVNGHAINTSATSTGIEIRNCNLTVTNASAYCLNSPLGSTFKYASNTYKGTTSAVNTTNITQGITNTQDNQGNILI